MELPVSDCPQRTDEAHVAPALQRNLDPPDHGTRQAANAGGPGRWTDLLGAGLQLRGTRHGHVRTPQQRFNNSSSTSQSSN
jgi:hypothetical protein